MNRGRNTLILSMVCALALTAFGAQSAHAAGTTAYTCREGTGVGATFSGSHCRPSDSAGEYGHFSIVNNTSTEVAGSNETTGGATEVFMLRAVVFGLFFELKATGVIASGWMENRESGGEMLIEGEGGALTPEFTGVTVVKPAGLGCKVHKDAEGGVGIGEFVEGNNIKATTKEQGDAVKFTPAFEKPIATFFLQSCSNKSLNKTYKVTGNVTGTPEGATVKFTHEGTTAQNTLKLEGAKAGVEGSITFKGRQFTIPPGGTYTPLSATT